MVPRGVYPAGVFPAGPNRHRATGIGRERRHGARGIGSLQHAGGGRERFDQVWGRLAELNAAYSDEEISADIKAARRR